MSKKDKKRKPQPIGFRLPGKRKPPPKRRPPRGEMTVYPPAYAWPVEEDL